MTRIEFCDRFAAHMIKHSGGDAESRRRMANYARAIAGSYYDEDFQNDPSLTPEDCAALDMSDWACRKVPVSSSLLAFSPGAATGLALFYGRAQNILTALKSRFRAHRK